MLALIKHSVVYPPGMFAKQFFHQPLLTFRCLIAAHLQLFALIW
jgi:hypothetical protein